MLNETRTRVQQRRAMCRPTADPTADLTADVNHGEVHRDEEGNSHLMCDSDILQCAICLEDESECPGIIKIHQCTSKCAHDQTHCCPHTFHVDCIQEWQAVCARR